MIGKIAIILTPTPQYRSKKIVIIIIIIIIIIINNNSNNSFWWHLQVTDLDNSPATDRSASPSGTRSVAKGSRSLITKIRDVHGICGTCKKCLSSRSELPLSYDKLSHLAIRCMGHMGAEFLSNPRCIGKLLWLQFRCRSHLVNSCHPLSPPRNATGSHWINWAAQQLVTPRIPSTPPYEAPTSGPDPTSLELRCIQNGSKWALNIGK